MKARYKIKKDGYGNYDLYEWTKLGYHWYSRYGWQHVRGGNNNLTSLLEYLKNYVTPPAYYDANGEEIK